MRQIQIRKAFKALVLFGILTGTAPANALIINLDFSGKFDGVGAAPYQAVANAAAELWQHAANPWGRVANHTIDIHLTTAVMGIDGGYALTHANFEQATANPVTHTRLWESSFITVNETFWESFYFDPTPKDNIEFNMNQYGGLFGTARDVAQSTLEDGLSLIVHELGHALGFMGFDGIWQPSTALDAYGWSAYTDFANNLTGTDAGPFVFDDFYKGAMPDIPLWGPYHIDGNLAAYEYDLMAAYNDGGSGPQLGQRRLISQLDAKMIADAFHLIPEPDTLLLAGLGLLAVGFLRRSGGRCHARESACHHSRRPLNA